METTTYQPEAPATTESRPEQLWLRKLVGEWTLEGEAPGEPGQPASKFTGTETVRSLGDTWFVAEGQGEMPGVGPATTLMTLGYDPRQQRCVGTWIGSMMAHLWIYNGTLDETGTVLTLDTEGPNMSDEGQMARYQDVIEFKNDDHRILTSHLLGDDGNWHQFMTAHYRRTK